MRYLKLLAMFFLGCNNAGINTVDPQASSDIKSSKYRSVFVDEYCLLNVNKTVEVGECWLEYCWKNEIISSNKAITKTNGLQLNLKILKTASDPIKENRYLIDWRMEVEGIGVLGRGNGVYILFMNETPIRNSFTVLIKKRINGMYKTIDSLILSK